MSLSEETRRVNGSQNDILKAFLAAFGVTVGSNKIDQLAALAKAAPLLKENSVLSGDTKTALGLDTSATLNDAFSILNDRINMISHGTASMTLTLKDQSGSPLKNIFVSGLVDENGVRVKTGNDGVATGFVTAESAKMSVNDYIDIEPWSYTPDVEKGQSYTHEATLTRATEKEISSNQSFMFSDNVDTFDVCAVGGGGGGGGSYTYYGLGYNGYYGGGGGGGGFVVNKLGISPTPNTAYSAQIGAGGAAGHGTSLTGSYNYCAGGKGGTTTLTCNEETIVSAEGGNGGQSSYEVSEQGVGGTGNGKGGNGIHYSGTKEYGSAGSPGTSYKFNESSLGVAGGGGGGGGTSYSAGGPFSGGSPSGGSGGVMSGNRIENEPNSKYPGGGGGGGGASKSDSSAQDPDTNFQDGSAGGKGALFLRWRFK